MYIALLGRQPALGLAELERVFGLSSVQQASDQAALVDTDHLPISQLGGTLKAGIVSLEAPSTWHQASQKIVEYYLRQWHSFDGKITLGLSGYGLPIDARELQKTGIILKQKLKKSGVSMRLVPNQDLALSTATSHHNKLGLSQNKVELLIVQGTNGRIIVAESTGAQNITAYTKRDQERPMRDAFVGMLPPKLAQIMINLAGELHVSQGEAQPRLLDPFCGTGVILQEAALMRYAVYGTDLSEKMIRYSRDNLNWLEDTHNVHVNWYLHEGDAIKAKWQAPINAVVAETYLGQPFSAPPSPAKLTEVKATCNHIISEFLKNIGTQIESGTPVCIAVPAWRGTDGTFTHLPLIHGFKTLGYKQVEFKTVHPSDLLYFRDDQVVARELLVLVKS
jgi:tRNA G10  N-methylase Trm11